MAITWVMAANIVFWALVLTYLTGCASRDDDLLYRGVYCVEHNTCRN